MYGVVKDITSDSGYKVELKNGDTITAYVSGKLRKKRIQILPGDTIEVEFSAYDLTKGIIVYRKEKYYRLWLPFLR